MRNATLEELLQGKMRPVLVEFDPPRQTEPGEFLSGAQELWEAGADVITIADCPIGKVSIDASLLAAKLKRERGIQVLPHMACRDRNLNAIQALLMGLEMEDVRQVLLITGDPVAAEDRENIKGVFQLNSRTLAEALGGLIEKGKLSPLFLCGALNVNARNFDAELTRARQKEESGIRAFLTQPISGPRAAENVRKARETLKGYILGGLFPIVSYKNACFLQKEVKGMDIDDTVLRLYEGLDRVQGEIMARRLCRDMARDIASFVDGYYIMTPFRRVSLVKQIIADIRGGE
ncbi:MAG: methylenetetrahydrofolate reductase [Clostridia bacterium]|nr:methylenetetrahydrofolate reductase [Clostridia bacterium]